MKEALSRRLMLKQSAMFLFAAAVQPLHRVFSQPLSSSTGDGGDSDLYVCCHGLFAFVFRDDHILLVTPRIREHRYLAGSWRQEKEMERGGSYSLTLGSKPGAAANPRPVVGNDNLHLSGIKNVDVSGSHCQIQLPFPAEFISLRHVKAEFEGTSFTAANTPSATFPILQILRYRVGDIQNCKLAGFEEYWKPDPHSSNQQLHIFAEPAELVPDDHAMRAFDALIQIFPDVELRLKSVPGRAPCPQREAGGPSAISLEQELSLVERDGSCAALLKGGKSAPKDRGPQPPNCFSLIVDNP